LRQIMEQTGLCAEKIAFMGDDLPDLAVMRCVGTAIAVADAHELIRQQAHMVTQARGGRGAVREVCEGIIKAQGKWEALIRDMFHG